MLVVNAVVAAVVVVVVVMPLTIDRSDCRGVFQSWYMAACVAAHVSGFCRK